MNIFTTGVQAIGGTSSASATPIPVVSTTEPTQVVHRVNLPAGFALTGGGTWDTLVAAAVIASLVTEIEVFMAGSDDVELARGAAAAEVSILRVTPGGNGRIPVDIAAGQRVAIRGNAGALTTGELIINFYGPA
jgi:hypothetical protein